MNNILTKLGFNEKLYSWVSFDMSIKKIFYRNILIDIIMLVCSIFLFTTNNIKGAVTLLLITLLFTGYIYYQYLYFTYGKFKYIVGKCVSVEKKTNEFLKRKYYERCTLTLSSYDEYYEIPIRASDDIEKDSEVIVYMSGSSMSQINENTYRIDNPITYSVISHPN